MKILNFGSCNLDMVYSVDHITRPGETNAASAFSLFPGGKGLNQSIALARAGATVWHGGCIGPDGDLLVRTMEESGVKLDHLLEVEEKTGHAIIQVDRNAENCIIIYSGANSCVTPTQIEEVLQHFDAGDILLLQNEISCLPFLVRRGAEKGMKVILNPSPFREALKELPIASIHSLILNETEALGMFDTLEPFSIQQYLRCHAPDTEVVLTLGENGSVYIHASQIFRQPPYPTKAADTTAAGDTFTGFYLAAVAEGCAPKDAMDRASAAASIAVSRKGASVSIPARWEVDQFLRR